MLGGSALNSHALGDSGTTLTPVEARHRAPFRAAVTAAHRAPFALLAPIEARHRSPFTLDAYNTVEGAVSLPAGFGVEGGVTVAYHLQAVVEGGIALSAPLLTEVAGAHTLRHDLLTYNEVRGGHTLRYELGEGAAIALTGDVTLTRDGQPVAIGDAVEIELGEGEHYWRARVSLKDVGDVALFRFADPVVLEFYGVTFNLVVDSRVSSRVEGSDITLNLVSPSALLGKPPAKPVSKVWQAPVMARAAVEELIGPVDWRIIDWLIPANRLGGDNGYPMDVARRIAEAAGAVIEPNPDGSLYVRYRHERVVGQWQALTPDHIFTEQEHIFSWSDNNQYFEIADQFRIADAEDAGFSDRIEFVASETSGLAGEIHAYPSPWRDVTLQHTGPSVVSLTYLGERTLSKTEQIEILEGKGTVQYPIQSIASVQWEVVNLGGLSPAEVGSTSVVSTTAAESLVTVTYTTRAKVWATTSPVDDEVQFVLYEDSP